MEPGCPSLARPAASEAEQYSNELRWAGNFTDNWEVTLGLYYFEQDLKYDEGRYVRPGGGLPPPATEVTLALGGTMDAENFGVFWNNDFYIGDSFTAQVGLRYTDESKTAQIYTAPCFDIVTFNCPTTDLQGDWDNVTPKLGFIQELSDDARVYGYWSKGFRSGGFNFRNARPNVIPPGPTREEESNMIEIGIKSEFNDGKVRLNVAAYHNEITDIQRELNVPDPFVVVLQGTINAGDVVIKGIEADIVALIGDNFSINAAIGMSRTADIRDSTRSSTASPMISGSSTRSRVSNSLSEPNCRASRRVMVHSASPGTCRCVRGFSTLLRRPHIARANFYNDSNSEKFDTQERLGASISWVSPDRPVAGFRLRQEPDE